jgi:hypothetical protein
MFISLASIASLLWAVVYTIFLHTVGPTVLLAAWGTSLRSDRNFSDLLVITSNVYEQTARSRRFSLHSRCGWVALARFSSFNTSSLS